MFFLVLNEISQNIGWIAMKFGTDIQRPQKTNPNDFCHIVITLVIELMFYL